jgi:serine/threonine protein kinase
MKLAPGTRLGPYEVISPVGAGGMGEVYRAKDTQLKRDVALKVLPAAFANDPERMARFRREAEVLAALNHPNIAAIYGIEQQALVMEMVEGETLKGPLPIETALNYARQIAEALEAAHEKNITHRDLKPLNIMITPEGVVKVLDFGLATVAPASAGDSGDPSNSPTLTIDATRPGMILGTAAYLSPEQAHGKPTDRRADIWAFGAVLYEMLTGKQAFKGESVSDTLASVLKVDPDWNALPAATPSAIRKLLRRCLTKDRKQRLQSIGEARITIEEVLSGASRESDAPVPASRSRWPWVAAAAVLVLAVAAGAALLLKPKPDQPMLQMEITPPDGVKFEATITPFALSPDGRRLAFLGSGKDGKRMLWIRSIDSSAAVALAGTESAEVPFWSPDSRWVGFSANGKLHKLDVIGGGQPQAICDIEGRAGGTWNSDGVVVFDQGNKPLQRVSADGGTPTPILSLDASRQETYHGAPYFLPDGRHLVYYSAGKKGFDIKLASLDGKLNRVLIEGGGAVTYAPNPHGGGSILYNVRGQLLARPFDLDKLEFTGQPVVIADGVFPARWWYASATGLLAFRHNYGTQYQLVWFSRDGRALGAVGDPGLLSAPRISPDQKTLAFSRTSDQNPDLWTFDLTRNTSARFTFEPGADGYPIWSSDNKSILYSSVRNSAVSVVERPANGVGKETVVVSPNGNGLAPTAVSRDGRRLVFEEASALHSVIALQSREDANKVIRVQDRETERDGSISPDGRWLLYSSIPAARREILVQSVPKEAGGSAAAVGKWQISTAGGSQPAWRADGKEIFYVAPDGMMMAVPVESGEDLFRPGTPKALFQTRLEFDPAVDLSRGVRQYDVTPDGQRFLLSQHVADATDAPITLVVNWPKLLQK